MSNYVLEGGTSGRGEDYQECWVGGQEPKDEGVLTELGCSGNLKQALSKRTGPNAYISFV